MTHSYSSLWMLQERERMRRFAMETPSELAPLEKLFVEYAGFHPRAKLDVPKTSFFKIDGYKRPFFEKASRAQQQDATNVQTIDILGIPTNQPEVPTEVKVIVLSPEQFKGSLAHREHATVLPALEAIMASHGTLIREITVHEPLIGTIDAMLGRRNLVHLDKQEGTFEAGPYTLLVRLETEDRLVARLHAHHEERHAIRKEPKLILNREFVEGHVREGAALRQQLGALGRYTQITEPKASVKTNSHITHVDGETQYHFWVPEQRKNIVLYTGNRNPYPGLAGESSIEMLPLRNREYCLHRLIENGIVKASGSVIGDRAAMLAVLAEDLEATGRSTEEVAQAKQTAQTFLEMSQQMNAFLTQREQTAYLLALPPQTLEYFLVPGRDEITAHLVLPRLYAREHFDGYHHTPTFIEGFEGADEAKRRELLQGITEHIRFEHEQNHDVNRWLYANHNKLCKDVGITFNEI